jgi:hypothetical protein
MANPEKVLDSFNNSKRDQFDMIDVDFIGNEEATVEHQKSESQNIQNKSIYSFNS